MDARELKRRIFNHRNAAALLVVVIVVGLWQGYGAWLLGGSNAG